MKKARSAGRCLAAALLLLTVSAAARAELVNCTVINSVPRTISSPGLYCLRGPLVLTGSSATGVVAISIQSSNVVLDLNGHVLDHSGTGPSIGVQVSKSTNVTIRNGRIRRFQQAVALTSSLGHLVEQLLVEGGSGYVIYTAGEGGGWIRNNVVVNYLDATGFTGIYSGSPGTRISDNRIISPGRGAKGIHVAGPGSLIERNSVTGAYHDGIFVAANNVMATGNRVTGAQFGIYFVTGFTGGAYERNTVLGSATAFFGGNGSANVHAQ